ncbi:hypothetical protein LQE92_01930 [Lacrimispora sp. NSJ-141]|uniref:Uncharacterized protein n=1 Tax=Lientehia hominis TaxID=2897778 RepID=A0AAP2RG61_9FIRM|nr:hypothetical protein [Lientehia hominis]
MWLKGYDNCVNGSYVPNSLSTSNGVALCQHMIQYIDNNWYGGSNPVDVAGGIYKYLKTQGVNHFPTVESSSFALVFSCVSSFNKPYILLIQNHGKYGNHWVTGYGYNDTGSYSYAVVNDGWGSSGIQINLSYESQIIH